MTTFFVSLCIIGGSCGTPALAAGAADNAEAKAAFASLYGSKVRDVTATVDKADDVALAQDLLAAAKLAQGTPALMALMCENAFQLGLRDRSGFAVSVAAMELLAEQRPEQRVEAMQRIVQARQLSFNIVKSGDRAAAGEELVAALVALADARSVKGDHAAALEDLRKAVVIARQAGLKDAETLTERVKLANHHAQLARQVDALRSRLLRDRGDEAAAQELVALYIRELNSPAKAAEYLPLIRDEAWRRHVELAQRDAAELNEADALALARWTREQAEQASAMGKAPLLARSAASLRRFLALHTAQDLERTQATLELKQLEDQLAAEGTGVLATPTTPGSDSQPAASAKSDGLMTVGLKPRKVFHEDPKMVYALAIDPAAKTLAIATQPEGTLQLMSLEKGTPLATLSDEKKWFSALAFVPRTELLAAADLHHDVHLFSAKTGKPAATLKKHGAAIYALAVAPDGAEMATAGADRAIHIWDVPGAKWSRQLDGHSATVRALAYSPATAGKRVLASAGEDKEIRLWTTGEREPKVLRGHGDPIYGLAFSPDAKLLATGDLGGNVIIWDLAKGEPKHRLHMGSFARVVAFSPDGTALIAGGEGKSIQMWHVASGKSLGEFAGHTQMITALLFTPDGRTLISAGTDKTVRLWDVVRQRSAAVSAVTK